MKSKKMSVFRMLLVLLLVLVFSTAWCMSALGESGTTEGHENERDGSKIESIHLHWVTADTVDDSAVDNLYLRTGSEAALSMQYQIDVSFSGLHEYAPGAIRITLPPQIWHARLPGSEDGETQEKYYGTLSLSVPDASSTKTDWHYEINEDGTYSIVNTKSIGSTSKVMFQLTVRDIVPYNIVDENISDDLKARCEVVTNEGNTIWLDSNVLTAQIDTQEVLSYAYKNGEFYEDAAAVPAQVLAKLPAGADPTKYVYVRWRTYPQYSGNQNFSLDVEDKGSVQVEGASYDAAADLAAYVGCYRVVYDNEGNETDLVWVAPAIMLGAENGGSVSDNVWTKDVLTDTWNRYGVNAYNNVCNIWTAYPAEDFEYDTTYRMLNKSTWTLTEQDPDAAYPEALGGTDPRNVTTADAKSSVTYTKAKWDYPPGRFMVFKYTEQDEDHKHNTHYLDGLNYGYGQYHKKNYTYEMALNHLREGEDVEMQYEVLTVGYGYVFTAGPLANAVSWEDLEGNMHTEALDKDLSEKYDDQWNSAEWAEDPEHYLNWYYVMDTTDRWDWFQNVDGEPENQLLKMNSDDYEFMGVTIASPEMFDWDRSRNPLYYFTDEGSTFGFIPDGTIAKPAVELWVELNNDAASESGYAVNKEGWVYVGSYTVEEGSTKYINFAELGLTGVTGYRTRIASNQAATKLAVYPHILLKASDRVRDIVENLFAESETPSTTFRNDDMMYVDLFHHAERTEVGVDKDVHPNQALFLPEENYTHVYIWQDDSRATLTGAGYGVVPHKSIAFNAAVDNDVVNHQVRLHYSAYVDEVSNLTEVEKWEEAVALGAIKPEKSGIWYDLLPEGVMPDLESIRVRDGDMVLGKPELRPNWRGTGRILMVVPVKLTPVPGQYDSAMVSDRPSISFDATYTWTDINNISSNLVNYIAFESGDKVQLGSLSGRIGEPDAMLRQNNNYTPNREPVEIVNAMTDLDPNSDAANFVYAKVDVNITVDQMAQTDYVKSVSSDLEGIWTQGLDGQQQVNIYEGQYYTYRLEVASAKDTVTSNMVMYDSIENYLIPTGGGAEQDATKQADHDEVESKKDWDGDWDRKTVSVGAEGYEQELEVGGQWRGKLVSVDVGEFVGKGCAPVIYYATEPWLQFGDTTGSVVDESIFFNYEGRYDLSDSATWTAVPASDLVDGVWSVPDGIEVTAIALDLKKKTDGSDFELGSEEACAAYLHMKAPDDQDDAEAWHAKGAYAHKNEDGSASTVDDIDWEKALDPVNNMHAYNNTRLIAQVTFEEGGANSYITMIRNDYTRVGIMPQIVEVEKTWDDDDDHDAKRPSEVTVTLMRRVQGEAGDYETVINETTGEPMSVTLSDENDWKEILYQVDVVNEKGQPYQYTFEETPVDGYTATAVKVDDTHFTVINTHENEKTEINGKKQWLMPDGSMLPDEAKALIPSEITLKLYRSDRSGEMILVETRTVTPDRAGNWEYSFTDLTKYERGGFEYTYSVEEEPVDYFWSSTKEPEDVPDGYTLPFEYDPDAVDIIYNFYIPYGDLSVTKEIVNATDVSKDQAFNFHISLLTETKDGEMLPLDGEYDYVIYDVAGEEGAETLTEVSSGKIGHDGSFQLKGSQRIVVKKIPSATRYTVTEETVDNWVLTGNADRSGKIPSATEKAEIFTNTYEASGHAQLKLQKKLTGHNMPANKFSFEIVDNNPDSPTYGQAIRPGYNKKVEGVRDPVDNSLEVEDTITFGALTYNELDAGKTFYYIVRECIPEEAVDNGDGTYTLDGYTYPDKSYEAKVDVADNGDGTMSTAVYYQDPESGEWKDGSEYQFELENSYHAEGKHRFMAWKKMQKREAEEGEFFFELVAVSVDESTGTVTCGDVLQTKPNNAEDEVIFDYLDFTELDVGVPHYYLVREVKGTDETVVYSDYQHLYQLTVIDNNNGTLSFAEDGQSVRVVTGSGTEEEYELVATGRSGLPVFTNDVENGRLKVTKHINNGSPLQTFNFYIELVGEGVTDKTLTFEYDEPEETPSELPAVKGPELIDPVAPVDYKLSHATASDLRGYPYYGFYVQGEDYNIFRTTDSNIAGFYSFARNFRTIDGQYGGGNFVGKIDETSTETSFRVRSGTDNYYWVSLDIKNWIQPKGLKEAFANIQLSTPRSSQTYLDFSKIDTSRTVTFERMFYKTKVITRDHVLDLSGFDTSSLTNMKEMFREFEPGYYWTLNIANFNTRNIAPENKTGVFLDIRDPLETIIIGDDTVFNDAPNDGYPGAADDMWFNNATGDVLTGAELFTEGNHGGSWTKLTSRYSIHFEPGEGAGAMQDVTTLNREAGYRFTNGYYRYGYEVASFRSSNGRTFKVNANGQFEIPANTFYSNGPFTLTPVWVPAKTDVRMTNGKGTFTLHGGDSIVFPNLPAYASYRVWEETPAGWIQLEPVGDTGTIMPLETAEALFTNEYAPGKASARVQGTKFFEGQPAEQPFTFGLYKVEAGVETLVEQVQSTESGAINFSIINYDINDGGVGTHNYVIREIVENPDETIEYDSHAERVQVVITDDGEGNLTSKVTYLDDNGIFRNKKKPGSLTLNKVGENMTEAAAAADFTFVVRFTDKDGNPVNVEGVYTTDNHTAPEWKENSSSVKPEKARGIGSVYAPSSRYSSPYHASTYELNGNAYAVYDTSQGSTLTFIRSYENVANGTRGSITDIHGTTYSGTIYSGVENGNHPWPQNYGYTVKIVDPIKPRSMNSWFRYCAINSINLEKIDTSICTDFNSMFDHAYVYQDLDLGCWDFSSAQNMAYMFNEVSMYNYNLVMPNKTIPVAGSNLYDFLYSASAKYINLNNWTLPNISYLGNLATECYASGISANDWSIPNATGIYAVFNDMYYTDVSAQRWQLPKATSISYVCSGSYGDMNLDGWYAPSARVTYAFSGFGGYVLSANNWTYGPQIYNLFYNNGSKRTVNTVYLNGWKSESADYFTAPFVDLSCRVAEMKNWELPACTNLNGFLHGTEGKTLQMSGWKVPATKKAVTGGTQFEYIDMSGWAEMPDLTDLNGLFAGSQKLKKLNLTGFDVSSVTNFAGAFASAPLEEIVGIEDFDVSSGADFGGMFTGNKLVSLDLSSWKPDKATNVSGMFQGCSNLKCLDISTFNLENVEQKNNVLSGTDSLNLLKIGDGTVLNNVYLPDNIWTDGTQSMTAQELLTNAGHAGTWYRTEERYTANGSEITFVLKAGGTWHMDNLPADVHYEIKETIVPDGWTLTSTENDKGVIEPITESTSIFTNSYAATGSAALKAEKLVEGEVPEGFKYTFQLFNVSEEGTPEGEALQTRTNNPVDLAETITVDETEQANPDYNRSMVLFDQITYDREGTYTYVITEAAEVDDPTIIPDSRTIKATVVVVDEEGKGKLTASVTYEGGENDNANAFLNKRKDGSLKISKTILNATEASENTEFTVTIQLKDKNNTPIEGSFTAVRTNKDGEETEETVTVTGGSAEIVIRGSETVLIKGLPHGAAYEAEEAETAGWTNTSKSGENGTIVGDKTSEAAFENTYKAQGELTLEVQKKMDPADLEIPDGAFSFILMQGRNELERVQNDASGHAVFQPIQYTLADAGKTFTYTILEQTSTNYVTEIAYAFDNTQYTVTVTVEDNGDGTLKAEPVFMKNGTEVTEVVFTNSTRVDIPIRKVWEGDADVIGDKRPARVLVELLADGEVVATRAISTTNASAEDSNIWESKFTGMPEYRDGRKIVYTIQETAPSSYEATIQSDEDAQTVVNTYYEAGVTLGGRKVTKGMKVEAGAFSFRLEPPYGGAPMPEKDTVTNDAEGNFSFGEMTFTLADLDIGEDGLIQNDTTLTYKVREVVPAEAVLNEAGTEYVLDGMNYDAKVYEIKVTLHYDAENNTFTATKDKEAADVVFTNWKTETSLRVVKEWVGVDGGKVELTLYRVQDGKYTQVTDAPEFEFIKEEGAYICEPLPSVDENMEEIVYAVKEKSMAGYLTTYVNKGEHESVTDAAFDGGTIINTYREQKPYEYRFTFTKKWTGSHGDTIDWTLYDSKGNVVHKKFNKKIISEDEWYYEAWFPNEAEYYIIETVPDGFKARYENTGAHAGETDRCYNGGTIINHKVPKTGDPAKLSLWTLCILLGLAAVSTVIYTSRRRR